MQVLDNGRRLHLADAAVATRSALSRFSSGVTAAFMTPLSAIQNALGAPAAPPSPATPSSAIPGSAKSASSKPASSATPASPTLSSAAPSSANVSSAQASVVSSDAHSLSSRRDSQSVEAAAPQTDGLQPEARVKVSVRAPSHSSADASPMEARLAGERMLITPRLTQLVAFFDMCINQGHTHVKCVCMRVYVCLCASVA